MPGGEGAYHHEESARTLLQSSSERTLKILGSSHLQGLMLHTQGLSGAPRLSQRKFGAWFRGIPEDRNARDRRYGFLEQFEALRV